MKKKTKPFRQTTKKFFLNPARYQRDMNNHLDFCRRSTTKKKNKNFFFLDVGYCEGHSLSLSLYAARLKKAWKRVPSASKRCVCVSATWLMARS